MLAQQVEVGRLDRLRLDLWPVLRRGRHAHLWRVLAQG